MGVYIHLKNLLGKDLPGKKLLSFFSDSHPNSEDGASLVEYALLISLIALVAFIAVAAFGGALSSEYSEIADSIP